MSKRDSNASQDEKGKGQLVRNTKPRLRELPRLSQNSQYLSVKEAARLLGVSERSTYGYIASGKLPGERIGQSIVVRRDTLDAYQRPAVGRPRTRTPIWRVPVETNLQYVLAISVRLCAGQEQRFKQKLVEMRREQRHLIPGTVARYISQTCSLPCSEVSASASTYEASRAQELEKNHPYSNPSQALELAASERRSWQSFNGLSEEIQIVLVWRRRTLPPEEERQAALATLRADFTGILDWETESAFAGPVALNT